MILPVIVRLKSVRKRRMGAVMHQSGDTKRDFIVNKRKPLEYLWISVLSNLSKCNRRKMENA